VGGDIVALDERGHPSFNPLQQLPKSSPVLLYAFDLPVFRGVLSALPLRARRELLRRTLRHARDPIRISESFDGRARDLTVAAIAKAAYVQLFGRTQKCAFFAGVVVNGHAGGRNRNES
jgi:ATP-dependent DNA ligase